jgi:light-regulated signal transduction histidine kinase (bacteriophytochrome)
VGASKRLGQGELNVTVPSTSNDEIGELSTTFNEMAKKLAEAQEQLKQKNISLAESLEISNQQKLDLEKVNKELDNFVHTVSHDLRSPLMGISGYGSVLKSQYAQEMDERANRCIAGILKGTERMNQMINDLLELTRLSRVQNPFEITSISDLMDEVLGRLEFRIAKDNVDVTVSDNLPVIVCDRIKLTEAIFNLVSNAMKFSVKVTEPDHRPRVEITCDHIHSEYVFSVKDNGIGIDPEDQDEVFGMFKRLQNAQEYEGTGAGLSIVKGVIDDHGGKIWIESQLGEGAKFIFTIPDSIQPSANES